MGTPRTIAAASLTALLLLAGCGGDDEPSASPTTTAASGTTASSAAATTTTSAGTSATQPTAAVRAALLQPADVPGSTSSTSSEGDSDLSPCFPGNPLGAKDHPSEVDSPDFELDQGGVQRQYSSSARTGTPEQAKQFVATFGSQTGSACILDRFKTELAAPPNPVDASRVTAKASSASVGDGGSLVNISGPITQGADSTQVSVDLLVFSKGGVVVFLSAGAFRGQVVSGQAVELARKIAGRLP